MTSELMNLVEDRCLAQVRGMVASYLRGGNMRKSTLAEIEGVRTRALSYDITEAKIKHAISDGINRSPNRNSQEAEEIRGRYLN